MEVGEFICCVGESSRIACNRQIENADIGSLVQDIIQLGCCELEMILCSRAKFVQAVTQCSCLPLGNIEAWSRKQNSGIRVVLFQVDLTQATKNLINAIHSADRQVDPFY